MVSSISLNAYSYNGIVSGTGSKLYVPVSPASVIYAQFDHISGVAAASHQNGISVSKIQILNSLLNQLITMRAQSSSTSESENLNIDSIQNNSSNSHIDQLIKNYQRQILETVETAQSTGYGLAGASPEAGVLFDITA